MDGAFMFCADLVRRLPMPVRLALVPIRSIDRGGNPSALAFPRVSVGGADVLVVEDILDSGRTWPL
jgi:hypoxanthine-guanine phosphoribosyltransferase